MKKATLAVAFFIGGGRQRSGPLLGGWSSLGLSGGVGLVLGSGVLVGGAASVEFCVSMSTVAGIALLLRAIAFEGGLAFAAMVAGAGALTALRLDASSTAVRAPAPITSLSRPPFALATVAGVEVPDLVTAASGDCEAVLSEGLMV